MAEPSLTLHEPDLRVALFDSQMAGSTSSFCSSGVVWIGEFHAPEWLMRITSILTGICNGPARQATRGKSWSIVQKTLPPFLHDA